MGDFDIDAYRAQQAARDAEQARLRPSHLDLSEVIAALEAEDPTRVLPLGFGNPHSYRGYYDELAFEPIENIAIGDMLSAARSAVGATYEGWKGGDYTMDAMTSCWLAYRGEGSGETIGRTFLRLLLAPASP